MATKRHAVSIALIAIASTRAAAQKPQLALVLPEQSALATEPPSVRSASLITDGAMLNLVRNGFPAHLHYRLERWSTGGFFDDITAQAEWDAVVRYDALGKVFQVFRVLGKKTTSLGSFSDIAAAEAALDAPFPAPISLPKRGKKAYYNLTLDVETLSLTELDEVEQWLRGEMKPAVRGKKNPGTAVGRGVRTVMVRLLGGEKRRYEARSGTFRP
ncbi:MAG TPA: hypothetical protein VM053_08335 [Gemmatimonadaceae bacterium]|nr:hypothetical protein [Gemmatimonadaceae bacterium]